MHEKKIHELNAKVKYLIEYQALKKRNKVLLEENKTLYNDIYILEKKMKNESDKK